MYRKPIVLSIISFVAGFLPLLITFLASAIAKSNSCKLHEGYSNPCILFGVDIGDALYAMGIMLWLSLVTLPIGIVVIVISLIWAVRIKISLLRKK